MSTQVILTQTALEETDPIYVFQPGLDTVWYKPEGSDEPKTYDVRSATVIQEVVSEEPAKVVTRFTIRYDLMEVDEDGEPIHTPWLEGINHEDVWEVQ